MPQYLIAIQHPDNYQLPTDAGAIMRDTDPAIWGANLPGSPVLGISDPLEHLTQFVIPVRRWSDGTEDRSEAGNKR